MQKIHAGTTVVFFFHHNAPSETASTGSPLHLPRNNNRGVRLPVPTIPVRCVPVRRLSPPDAACLYAGTAWADNQGSARLLQSIQVEKAAAAAADDPASMQMPVALSVKQQA